jgi:cation:H+ antiporter
MFMDYVFILVGMVLLYYGGEFLVNNAVTLARSWGVSTMVVGLTVVAFGTSSPELAASLAAALQGSPEIAVGNVIGSNIFNILGILGLTSIIAMIKVQSTFIAREVPILLGVTVLGLWLLSDGTLGRLEGLLFIVLLLAYIIFLYFASQKDTVLEAEMTEAYPSGQTTWRTYLGFFVGLVFLGLGARVLVMGAVGIARGFGVSELIIGLTVVALGTSLPEIAASVIAALKKEPDIALGNVIGSNIFNILCILGITALVSPIGVSWQAVQRDAWVMLGVTVLFVPFLITGRRLSRLEGSVLVTLYIAYVVYVLVS